MSETMQLVKVDPKEFGIEEARAKEIAAQFKPMLDKMAELEEEFNRIMKLPVTPENIRLFKECRLKYVKTRTGTADIHKKQKAYFRAGGLYCDAWKNTQSFASIGKEDALMEREKHFENLEKERIENLRAERWENLSKYMEIEPQGLGQMDEAVYNHFLNGAKTAHEEKIAAEKKAEADRLERERIEKLVRVRESKIAPVYSFFEVPAMQILGELTEDEFQHKLEEAQKAKSNHEAEQKKQRKENERLKIEAEKREKAIAEERKKQAEKEAKERAEREKERAVMEAKLKAEADAREKAEREIREKKEAEEKARKKAEAEAKKAAKAPVKSKMKNAVESLEMVRFTNMEPEEHSLWLKITEKHEAFKKWALEQIETL